MRYLILLLLSACMTASEADAYDLGVSDCTRYGGDYPPVMDYSRGEWRAYQRGWTDAGCEWRDGYEPWLLGPER